MQAIVDQHVGSSAAIAAGGGDVDKAYRACGATFGGHAVEGIDLGTDQRRVAAVRMRKQGQPPVRNRQHEHARRNTAGQPDCTQQQRIELAAVLVQRAPAVLVVDADQQAHQIERPLRRSGFQTGLQFVGGPAGGGDDLRRRHIPAVGTQTVHQLRRPALPGGDPFADGVGIAERQIAQRRAGHRHHATLRDLSGTTLVTASARRARARSMRANTSRITAASGINVTRKWWR